MLIFTVMGISRFIGHAISNEFNFLYLIILGLSAMIGGFLVQDIQIALVQQISKD